MKSDFINLSAREAIAHAQKSQYTLVDTPLFRKLLCKQDYDHYDGKIFEKGKEYAVWITQCYRPTDRQRRFKHYVAVPHHKLEAGLQYYAVPEEVFGEYEKGDIPVVCEIAGTKFKLINDFEGQGLLVPLWAFSRKQMRAYAEKTLGPAEFGYILCARIFGADIDYHNWFLGWEIWAKRNKINTVRYFNIFEGEFVRYNSAYPFQYPIQSGGKKICTGHSVIKADKGDLVVRMPTPLD